MFMLFEIRMITDDQLYYDYHWNKSTRVPGDEPGECEGSCRIETYCSILTHTNELYQQCIDERNP